jgi:hypothetical protein
VSFDHLIARALSSITPRSRTDVPTALPHVNQSCKRGHSFPDLIHSGGWVVENVRPPISSRDAAIVDLACIDDDAQGQSLSVLWQVEPDASKSGCSVIKLSRNPAQGTSVRCAALARGACFEQYRRESVS